MLPPEVGKLTLRRVVRGVSHTGGVSVAEGYRSRTHLEVERVPSPGRSDAIERRPKKQKEALAKILNGDLR